MEIARPTNYDGTTANLTADIAFACGRIAAGDTVTVYSDVNREGYPKGRVILTVNEPDDSVRRFAINLTELV